MQRLLIVDRDGVINEESATFIKRPSEWIPMPGSLAALGAATRAGYRIFVVSNQSGLARGLFDIEDLHRIHARLLAEASLHGGVIEGFLYCPHAPDDGCDCRKPQPGLVRAALTRSGLSATEAVMIGDRRSDLDAARAGGVKPVLVMTGHGSATAATLTPAMRCPIFADLAHAVAALGRGVI